MKYSVGISLLSLLFITAGKVLTSLNCCKPRCCEREQRRNIVLSCAARELLEPKEELKGWSSRCHTFMCHSHRLQPPMATGSPYGRRSERPARHWVVIGDFLCFVLTPHEGAVLRGSAFCVAAEGHPSCCRAELRGWGPLGAAPPERRPPPRADSARQQGETAE